MYDLLSICVTDLHELFRLFRRLVPLSLQLNRPITGAIYV